MGHMIVGAAFLLRRPILFYLAMEDFAGPEQEQGAVGAASGGEIKHRVRGQEAAPTNISAI